MPSFSHIQYLYFIKDHYQKYQSFFKDWFMNVKNTLRVMHKTINININIDKCIIDKYINFINASII